MRKQLTAMQTQLADMLLHAQHYADSDNEETATRYERVVECLDVALDAITDGIDALN